MSELSASPPAHGQPAISVLVVDDQPIAAKAIRRLLASAPDIAVHYCQEPTQALAIATEIRPSVILQDLVMPNVDGLILVKFFRAHPTTRNTPIIVLSSKGDPEVKAAAFSAGANDYLVKLPDPIELIARLRYHAAAYQNLLKRYEAEQTRAYSKTLENQVEVRTAELKQALDTLKQAQAQLIHTEKMSSMGQLVAGIAHEVNNPINFIYGNLNYINGYVEDLLALIQAYQQHYPSPPLPICEKLEDLDLEFTSPDLLRSFTSLRSGAKRIRDLVLNLRNFSRFDQAAIKTVDLHEGIDSTLAMLAPDLAGVIVEKEYSELPLVECYAGQLNQVFMHLIRNALDALKLSADANADKSPLLHISTAIAQNNRVAVWIADNGPGILPEIQERIFDPFFTTRAVGQGTGLGLSISYQIVTGQHQGRLKCYSMPGQGAKFLIELPVCLAAAEPPDEPPEIKHEAKRKVLQGLTSGAGDLT
ncbi:response regulator [Leptolyngbya sp. BC1307]|uniref:hybrid sensor histidine kinase/response regulator n=1 Tax=Leptolyngbya sp. BC1307 TaxID=2029589 RepID=UPI000EFC3077|nr:response regulator [Leptolyngbya sp. BC1307]